MPRSPATPDDDFRPRDYPVEDDIAFQRKLWRVERVGWGMLVILVLLTLLGLFSKGPLSTHQQMSADGHLQLDYQRFLRQGASSSMIVTLQGEPGALLEMVLEAPFFVTYRIDAIHPQPLEAFSEHAGLKLRVRADRDGRASVHFTLRPEEIGTVHHRLRFDSRELKFWQLIYP
jgi:hypothetical protein